MVNDEQVHLPLLRAATARQTTKRNNEHPRAPNRTSPRAIGPTYGRLCTLVRDFMSAFRSLSRRLFKVPARIHTRNHASEHAPRNGLKPTRFGQPLFVSHPHLSQ